MNKFQNKMEKKNRRQTDRDKVIQQTDRYRQTEAKKDTQRQTDRSTRNKIQELIELIR